MPRKKSIIAANPMEDLIRKAGAERVGEDAAKAVSELLEEIGLRIAREAVLLCKHAGRKTVKREDIEMARSKI